MSIDQAAKYYMWIKLYLEILLVVKFLKFVFKVNMKLHW